MTVAPIYLRIAEDVARQVSSGALRDGDRVPSLRALGRQMRVSVTTALQAYLWLESRGYLESRPRSGFFIRTPFSKLIPEPAFRRQRTRPTELGSQSVLTDILEEANDPSNVPFGMACADPDHFPSHRLNLILQRIVRESPHHSAHYQLGAPELRRQIARRSLAMGCAIDPRDVTITSGALEAVQLSIRVVTKPGDVIAVETPTYFGILGSAASQNLKVLEIPTHPQEGIDLDELEAAVRKHRVKAIVVMTNGHNPLGYVLPDGTKKALAEIAERHEVPVIEDDLFGDLAHSGERPKAVKSFDQSGLVIHCSSFSKSLSPGYRVGWAAAGVFHEEVQRLKFLTSIATPTLSQLVIAEFLESGGYDRHLKRFQPVLARQAEQVRNAVAAYFPEGTRISRPAAGHTLWIELPPRVDSLKLYRAALDRHISILPGVIFSASERYRHHIRINCGYRWTSALEQGLSTLGRLCERAS